MGASGATRIVVIDGSGKDFSVPGFRKGRERISSPNRDKGLLARKGPVSNNLAFLSVAVS